MNDVLRNLIVDAAQGNPGAVTVLVELSRDPRDQLWLTGLLARLKVTQSKAPNLWLVYKDESGGSTARAKFLLDKWLKESKNESLGYWLSKQGLRCSEQAGFYV